MSMQTDLIVSDSGNSISKTSKEYSLIDSKEDYYMGPKDIKLGIYSKGVEKPKKVIYPVNSDYLPSIPIEKQNKYCYKKLGNTYSFFGDIYGNPRIIIGPHWYLFVFVTIFFSSIFSLEVIFFYKYSSFFMKFTGFFIYFIFLFSYSYTALINPGYPKHDINSIIGEPRDKFIYCSTCKMWINKEKNIQHCFDCDICVEGLDHHCPWTGKCIGAKNLISFYIFVGSIFILIVHFMLVGTFLDKKSLKKK